MRTIHIVNPYAGKGNAEKQLEYGRDEEVYYSKCIGDIEEYTKSVIDLSDEVVKFVVYGGDGSINEAVNGIMKSHNPHLARIKVVAAGSGNDFVKMLSDVKGEHEVDLIKYNDRYAINMLNIGFDCNVVIKTSKYKKKPLVSGPFAYVLGVADELFGKIGENFIISVEDVDGNIHEFTSGSFLLCCIANGQYCGGGFKSSPISAIDDGILEVLVVNKVSRAKFVSLVSRYKSGDHIDMTTLLPKKEFQEYISYIRFKKMHMSGLKNVCADGEISQETDLTIEVAPKAVIISD